MKGAYLQLVVGEDEVSGGVELQDDVAGDLARTEPEGDHTVRAQLLRTANEGFGLRGVVGKLDSESVSWSDW